MRITRNQLHDLINEEVAEVLLKSENRHLVESFDAVSGLLREVDALSLIDFAKAYSSLDKYMRKQLDDIIDDVDADVDPEDVADIERAIGGANEEIDSYLSTWKQSHIMKGDD